MLDMNRLPPYPVIQSACLPSSCETRDIEALIKHKEVVKVTQPLKISIMSTESKSDGDPFQEFYFHRILASTVIYGLLSLVFVTTFYPELFKNNSLILESFSLTQNNAKIFADTPVLRDERFYFFNFFKFNYVIIGCFTHTIFLITTFNAVSFVYPTLFFAIENQVTHLIGMGAFGVNMIFIGSASMAVINLVPLMKAKKMSFPLFFLGRALRTIPVLAAVDVITIAFPFVNSIGSGPLFLHIHKDMVKKCVSVGWKDLLFLSNTIPFKDMCNGPAWFTAVDFKVYALSFFTFTLLAKDTRLGILAMVIQAVCGCIWHFYYLQSNNVFPPITTCKESPYCLNEIFDEDYFETSGYVASYVVGMALGVALLTIKKSKSVNIVYVSSALSAGLLLMLPFKSLYDPVTMETKISRNMQLLIAVLIRPLCLSTIAIIFYNFFLTSDTVINFSKHKVFTWASRFSFSAFAIHTFFITYLHAVMPIEEFTFLSWIMRSMFVLICSIPAAYLIMVTVEYPFNNMIKRLFESGRGHEKDKIRSGNGGPIYMNNNVTDNRNK